MKKTCIECSEYKNCKDSLASWGFVIIGLIATVAIRLVTVLMHLNPLYAKMAWYIGIAGFLAFFVYKFRINQNRARVIARQNLISKINNQKELTKNDYKTIGAILCGVGSRKERINYFFIFVLSAAALLLAIYMDFLK
ncbi:MAG: hypothetical protein ISS92_06025 [Candidatus Omnitrophica bacterium]|nr:hypothetical protein [Candidatus Omnitrophota bacterium]